ncbi:Unknown [Streptococcus agalactiae NEM316]|uniref:Uncharacterized protein n=1 Tax=Streptococcus agalactiae serotype III (strain NEM316) TaxID=211110 RepID=Q8E5X7_STRA3|nr:Unknown-related protein [Streptococcus agalactiae 515]CAD46496.1 Unknown [Streptococcus agalactiae NEM316]
MGCVTAEIIPIELDTVSTVEGKCVPLQVFCGGKGRSVFLGDS